jgi:hypothetical protein
VIRLGRRQSCRAGLNILKLIFHVLHICRVDGVDVTAHTNGTAGTDNAHPNSYDKMRFCSPFLILANFDWFFLRVCVWFAQHVVCAFSMIDVPKQDALKTCTTVSIWTNGHSSPMLFPRDLNVHATSAVGLNLQCRTTTENMSR